MAPRNRGGARKGGTKVGGKAKGGALAEASDDYLPTYLKNVPNLPWHPEATRTGLRIFSFVMLAIFAFMMYSEQMKYIPTAVPGGKVFLTRQMTVDPADDDSQGAVFPEGMEGTFVSYPTGNAVPEFGTVVLNGMEFELPCDAFRIAHVEESSDSRPSGEADL